MPETLSPETFDFDEWFADANLPEESADIYTRADVISELRDLERRIELADAVEDAGENTVSEKSASAQLRDQYEKLAETFTSSKITVYLRALTGTKRQEILEVHNAAQKKDKNKETDAEFMFRLLSESIVGLKRAGGERKPMKLGQADVRRLYLQVGDAQIQVLRNAYLNASNAVPEVSADFLPGASSKATTDE